MSTLFKKEKNLRNYNLNIFQGDLLYDWIVCLRLPQNNKMSPYNKWTSHFIDYNSQLLLFFFILI